MLLTVTLNAAIDKQYVVTDVKEGEVNRVLECTYTPGGKGLNVSKSAAIAGAQVVATGLVGGHAGNYITENLEPLGIQNEFYHLEGESRSCINIWNQNKRTQTEFLEPGFTVSKEEFRGFKNKFFELVKKTDVVVLSGSTPKGLGVTAYSQLIKIAKAVGKKVILDTSGELLREGIKANPTMIKPNIDEIKMLTGWECNTREGLLKAAKKIHEKGVEIVVISLGAEGAIAVCDEGNYQAIVPKMDAINTVGCGDAMIAGFALGIETETGIVEMLRRASAISAAAALREETGYFIKKDMEWMMSRIQINRL